MVEVGGRHREGDLIAGAHRNGIWLSEDALTGDGISFAATLLEEIAHLKLLQLGAGNGLMTFVGAFVQEYFATWFLFTELIRVAPTTTERFHDAPIGSRRASSDFGYHLGPFFGAAAAGIPRAQDRVRVWLDADVDPEVRAVVDRVTRVAERHSGAVEKAIALARLSGKG